MGTLPPAGGAAQDEGAGAERSSEAALPRPQPLPVRVVVVDDHALMREGTVELLEKADDIMVVGQAGTGDEALRLLEHCRADVMLVDVNLPGMSGLELARIVGPRYPQLAVLIVSAYSDYAYVTEALEAGVGGYLLKTASAKELLDAVRSVSDGVFVLDKAVSSRLARRWRREPAGAVALTAREAEVLRVLARGWSNKQIAAELCLGVRTVESHVSSLLAKLQVASRAEAVAYALRHHLVDSLGVPGNGQPPRPS